MLFSPFLQKGPIFVTSVVFSRITIPFPKGLCSKGKKLLLQTIAYSFFNPFRVQIPVLEYCANCADPVQTPQTAASDQGLHCLLTAISIENTVKLKSETAKNWNWIHQNDTDEQIHWSKKG